jgi:formate dehydrogenase major subunit
MGYINNLFFQSTRSKKRVLINLPALKKRNLVNKNRKKGQKERKKRVETHRRFLNSALSDQGVPREGRLDSMVLKIGEIHTKGATVTPSICPYCSVGCATIIHTKNGRIVNIEGDPKSPHNEGALCPKGAATYQLHVNPNRETRVLHRRPGAREWKEVELGWAMDRVAELVSKTREETFVERLSDGSPVNHTLGIFALGGATLDNEWNHLQQKLMRGLGVVAIENQARI